MAQLPAYGRRFFLQGLVTTGIAGALATPPRLALAQTQQTPTPACDDGDEPTPEQTEGPFFTRNSPERSQLREPGMPGTPISLTGLVLTRSCRPVAGALVELWHADDAGVYDNQGFRLRGHLFTGPDASYRFDTIVPGLYPGRTRHFHVKYQAPDGPVLTTQLYFPGEPRNERDGIFSPELIMQLSEGPVARFDTILDMP